MPSALQNAPGSNLGIDRASNTIRLARDFDAPPADIFEAWTKPEHVTCWWDAAGDPLAVCEIDLRPGGSFRFVTRGHPDLPFAGVYREIAPPDRLIFEALGSTGRVLIREADGRTHMIVEIECSSSEQLDQFLKMGVSAGTGRTLDSLVAYMRSRASRAA
ncbi:MAG: SRPBCC domain-containing protein [Roseiarcus sp.]|uniref:SRPBCC domain-containing protein n=1 Tax=Roseiarcus sp. TaxID=1969460 RepID=UPI003C41A95B